MPWKNNQLIWIDEFTCDLISLYVESFCVGNIVFILNAIKKNNNNASQPTYLTMLNGCQKKNNHYFRTKTKIMVAFHCAD